MFSEEKQIVVDDLLKTEELFFDEELDHDEDQPEWTDLEEEDLDEDIALLIEKVIKDFGRKAAKVFGDRRTLFEKWIFGNLPKVKFLEDESSTTSAESHEDDDQESDEDDNRERKGEGEKSNERVSFMLDVFHYHVCREAQDRLTYNKKVKYKDIPRQFLRILDPCQKGSQQKKLYLWKLFRSEFSMIKSIADNSFEKRYYKINQIRTIDDIKNTTLMQMIKEAKKIGEKYKEKPKKKVKKTKVNEVTLRMMHMALTTFATYRSLTVFEKVRTTHTEGGLVERSLYANAPVIYDDAETKTSADNDKGKKKTQTLSRACGNESIAYKHYSKVIKRMKMTNSGSDLMLFHYLLLFKTEFEKLTKLDKKGRPKRKIIFKPCFKPDEAKQRAVYEEQKDIAKEFLDDLRAKQRGGKRYGIIKGPNIDETLMIQMLEDEREQRRKARRTFKNFMIKVEKVFSFCVKERHSFVKVYEEKTKRSIFEGFFKSARRRRRN